MTLIPNRPRNSLPILDARSGHYFWKGQGALSIKTFRNGRAVYEAGHGHFAVGEGSYLLLNHGQEYSITIEAQAPVESFCIFFPEHMTEEIYRSLITPEEKLLDDPLSLKPGPVDFVEKTYGNDEWLTPALLKLKAEYGNKLGDDVWLDEQLHDLAQRLLQVHRQVHREMLKLPSRKASTREELFRRVSIGHDYMTAYYAKPITLEEIAGAACLSPNHFLRCYKQLFGQSPHQYLTELRLREAKRLLLRTDTSITDICLNVGFHSPSSFSGLFAKRFGASPSRFRQKK
ncbi:helix-turn-helix transcriptional regulator [Paenibacillus elgii]|uniref:helix-turn-helix transcriptional regulator n=1 Tax=Paenibacillus elgii TaxID=189691 RepID=UPI000FDB746F|nr:helix-turn-helix transcriptional regulator [Paenibacillus elgii]NEN82628.1 helix-turn-helix transcriptional regulator [Paenibacillus elgii]